MPKKIGLSIALAACFALAALPAAAADLWFHATIEEGGPDATSIVVNLPVSLVETAFSLIPEEEMRDGKVVIDDAEFDARTLREVWNELKNTRDATFVTIRSNDESIRVAKDGNYLIAETFESGPGGAEINARLPMAVVDALLSGDDDELNLRAALQALIDHGSGELVTLREADTNIRVWVDNNPNA